MRGMTKLAMAATLAVVLTLALFFTLILSLLADLFCCLLCRESRPRFDPETPDSTSVTEAGREDSSTRSVSKFPFYAHGVLQAPTTYLLTIPKLEAAAAPIPAPDLKHFQCHSPIPPSSSASVSSVATDRFVYISNPVYDGVNGGGDDDTTPFETPETSPSHLGLGEEEEDSDQSPPLTVMKKLAPVRRNAYGTSVSAAETNQASSSSSSNTLCFSPSW
ncbi:uncharacterized protein [Typha angustifolia]|uniref:uncharacterized protein isoform X1 n=2 Tax=Typha angustifolia TaxID=59011 RepID=UPI003C2BBBE6